MKDRYGLRLPNGRWVSIKQKGGMLFSSWGVGKNKQNAPPHYTHTNIFKVLRVRYRVLNGEPVYRIMTPGSAPVPEYFNEATCVKIEDK